MPRHPYTPTHPAARRAQPISVFRDSVPLQRRQAVYYVYDPDAIGFEGEIGDVYVVHLAERFGHAQHYIGWSRSLRNRLWHHHRGSGAHFLREVNRAGIKWAVVAVHRNVDRHFERALKNRGSAARCCPPCQRMRRWAKNKARRAAARRTRKDTRHAHRRAQRTASAAG